jgi:hypothetical protein
MATPSLPSVRPITVREIAKRIRGDREELEVVINRLRNWTKEGLLEFSGDKHPGTGRARFYPEYAVIDALVISALTATGIPAVRAGSATGAYSTVLALARSAYYQDFKEKEAASITLFLVVLNADGTVYDSNADRAWVTSAPNGRVNVPLTAVDSDITIFINLSSLFRRLEKRIGEN